MDTLLSVLMFLNTINPNSTYQSSYINQQAVQLAPVITSIEINPPVIQSVIQVFAPLVPTIIIINDDDDEYTGSAN